MSLLDHRRQPFAWPRKRKEPTAQLPPCQQVQRRTGLCTLESPTLPMDQGPGPVLPEHLESIQLNLGAPPSSVHTSASTQGVSDIRSMGDPQRAERREKGSHTSEQSANGWSSVWSVHASDQSNPTLDLSVKPSLAHRLCLHGRNGSHLLPQ